MKLLVIFVSIIFEKTEADASHLNATVPHWKDLECQVLIRNFGVNLIKMVCNL